MANKMPDSTDREIGERIRSRRMTIGMTLSTLADTLGISYQQVQKYEKGLNRVSGSRLSKLSDTLGVSVSYFYEGPPRAEDHASPVREDTLVSVLRTKEGKILTQAFARMDERRRKALVAFLKSLD